MKKQIKKEDGNVRTVAQAISDKPMKHRQPSLLRVIDHLRAHLLRNANLLAEPAEENFNRFGGMKKC